jgi:hypothetical protein
MISLTYFISVTMNFAAGSASICKTIVRPIGCKVFGVDKFMLRMSLNEALCD